MSVTGIMHGNTLSFTRLMITQPILKLVTNNPNFGSVESEFLQTTSSTIVGVIDDRSVFSDKLCYDYKKFGPELKGVINKFAGLSSSLKVNYFSKIKKYPNFSQIGWIISDYCSDEVDGKQLTITTYI